jgi:predicted permease
MAGLLGWAAVMVAAYYLLGYAALYGLGRALALKGPNRGLFTNLTVLANTGFIGFPLIQQLYGAEGGLYAIVYNLGFNLSAFTLGLALIGARPTPRKFLTHPMILLSLSSLLLFVSPFRLPPIVTGPLAQVGVMAGPFSLFIIGAAMAKIRFVSLFTNGWAWLVTLLRQLALPGIAAGGLYLAGFSGLLPAAIVVLTGIPSATMNVIFAEQYNGDTAFASRAVVQGTLLMAASLPAHVWLCARLFF